MYQTKVIKAKQEYLRHKEKQNKKEYSKRKSEPALWPSDLFSCHRKAAHHIIGTEATLPFSDKSLAFMHGGNVLEDDTGEALIWKYGKAESVVLKNGVWSGRADFVLDHKTQNVCIVEHKATGASKFKDDKQLPKKEHIGQLALYEKLYLELYHYKPQLILYYMGWGCEAEFDINVQHDHVLVTGVVKNFDSEIFVSKRMRINIQKEIDKLEAMYKDVLSGGQLPPRLDKKYKGCSFLGKPSCSYYFNCYPNERR